MLKKKVYENYIRNKESKCCSERAWNNWNLYDENGQLVNFDVIYPDVSRVFRRPYDISKEDFPSLKNLFNRKRQTNL